MNQVKQRVKQVFPTILQYVETCYEDLYCFFFLRQKNGRNKTLQSTFLAAECAINFNYFLYKYQLATLL